MASSPTPGTNNTTNQSMPQQVQTQTQPSHPTVSSQTGQTTSTSVLAAWLTDLPLTERYITDPHWPAKLQLDLNSGNWEEWSHRMCIIIQNQGFNYWLHGTFAEPNLSMAARHHYTWKSNDKSLWAFLLHTISRTECKIIKHLPMANAVWNALCLRYENCGLYAQLMLIKECLAIRFTMATPLNKTINQIDNLIARISNMGDIDWSKFKTIMLINALGSKLEHIQSQIHSMADDPGFSAEKIVHHIHRKCDLVKHRTAQGEGPPAGPTALLSQTG
jgi:hypothetical protein